MKITLLKSEKDKKSFRMLENMGIDIFKVSDLEKTDDAINRLIKQDYRTIIMTNEVAGFSESIIKKYSRTNDIKIIIAPPK